MAGSPESTLAALVEVVKASKLDRDKTADLFAEVMGHLIDNNIPGVERWAVSMTISAYIKKVRGGAYK